MISEYGSMESGIIAFECPSGGLHIVEENVILEVIEGEVVVTNLLSKSFPIIRYRLGDSISLDSDRICECGMKHTLINEIHGRTGKLIYGKHGQYPSLTLYYIFKNLILSGMPPIGYQAVQKEKGIVVFYFDRKFTASERASINKECLKYFSDDVECVLSSKLLQRDYSRKFESYLCEIN
jgi:phenylacetate-CoA ligase